MTNVTATTDILEGLGDALTSKELTELLADLLGYPPSTRTVERWRSRGTGPPYILVAGRVRYLRGDVAEWLDTRRRRSTSTPIYSHVSQ